MTGIAERTSDNHATKTTASALTSRQRTTFRGLLAEDHEQTSRLIEQLGNDMSGFTLSRRDSASDDEHDPEGPTLAFERSQASAILKQSVHHVGEIDSALGRMDDGSYGLCTTCTGPIKLGRLQVRPQAGLCISCAERLR
jgi:RNA polymerase-binding transcription factor DksA